MDAAGEIYGDVANIAARVQALAEPGAVLITTRVQRQIAGLFIAEDRGTHALKGVPEATVLYRLVRATRRPPFRAAQSHAAHRPRRRDDHALAALASGPGGRRAIGDDLRRSGSRQVAVDRVNSTSG
jgi:hypothetical protein